MWIGQAARAAGVNQQTLRYYERRGLLPPPPRRGAFRACGDDARFIKAQDPGFSLDEIEELLRLRGVAQRERHRIRVIAERKLADIHVRIARLQAMKKALAGLVTSCRSGATPNCPMIESLSGPPAALRRTGAARG